MEHCSFQSEFACELDFAGKDSDLQFKSEFAADLQSSLVIVKDKETVDDQEKLFDDSNYSYLAEYHQSDQILNSTARSGQFPSKPILSTISRVETVLSFNHGEGKAKCNRDNLGKVQTAENYIKLQKELKDLQVKLDEVEHSQMQHVAANKQMMMLLQRVTSQLAIKTALDTKNIVEGHVQRGVEGSGGGGGTSFRRQRGVRAKRGESIKKSKLSSDRSPWLKQRYPELNTSDLSSDESGDSGRYSEDSETCNSRNSSEGKSEDLARRGVEILREGWKEGTVSDTQKCKIPDDDARDNKVVITIDREGKHQIKQGQRAMKRKQHRDTEYVDLQSKTIQQDSFGRMRIHVPCVGQEEIFNVWM